MEQICDLYFIFTNCMHFSTNSFKVSYKNVLEMLDNPNFLFMTVNGGSTYNLLKNSKIAYQKVKICNLSYKEIFRVIKMFENYNF